MAPPGRYFDSPGSSRGSPRGGARGGGAGRGRGRGRGGASRGPPRDERPKKEPFKPKEGFIAAGLKAYADAAEATSATRESDLKEGWKDKSTTQTTLYLSNLPSELSSPQLSLIFSSYAPVRSAFVVSQSGAKSDAPVGISGANLVPTGAGRDRTGKSSSRGFGYVRFVLKTDAEKCLEEWGTQSGIPRSALKELEGAEGTEGIDWARVCGREGVKMSWAKKKLKEGEAPEGAAKKAKKEKRALDPAEPEADEQTPRWRPGVFDHNASRTVIVQGIPTEEEIAAAKAAKAAAKTEKMAVDGDEPDDEDDEEEKEDEDEAKADGDEAGEGESSGKAIDWKKALKQKAKKIGDVEDVQYPVALPSGETVATILFYSPRSAHEGMKKLNNHVFRGIIVGACVKSSWDLTQRLGKGKGGGRLVVRNLGFDVSVADLRTVFAKFGSLHSINYPKDSATGKTRGFAFIYFVVKSEAEKALKAVNGSRIYAGLAEERIASEGGKEGKKKEVREKRKREEKEQGGGGGEKGRIVAVDWALGKDDFKKAQEAEAEREDGTASEGDSDERSSEDEDDSEDESDSDEEKNEDDESEDDVSDSDPELDEEPTAPAQAKGTTLFVRNISFEATEAELYDLFKEFGPVRYARIVYDPTTKRSRGTAFVCFWNDDSAEAVLAESESLNAGLFGETSDKKKNSQPQSLLMPDASTSKATKLTLHGRVLAAVAAVSKDDADKFREDRDKKGGAKADRRNLYLMREGVIFPSWAIAQTLHPSDLAARQSSFDARKSLLRSNPSLYISRTRLSVRQIPLYATDGMMKRLANYALRAFEKEVAVGHQKALTEDELNEKVVDAAGPAATLTATRSERIKGVPPSRVRQAKILRQSDRLDPLTGVGRSKGYGFLELASHADALRVLRWANANKEVGALLRGWWRESLEKLISQVEAGEKVFGKSSQSKDKDERLKRLREKMAELEEEEELARGKAARAEAKGKVVGEGGRSQKSLIIEFSIENATVTKRRAEKVARSREKAKRFKDSKNAAGDSDDDSGPESDDGQPASKKRKAGGKGTPSKKAKLLTKAEQAAEEAGEAPRPGLSIGAIIGRKRKGKK